MLYDEGFANYGVHYHCQFNASWQWNISGLGQFA